MVLTFGGVCPYEGTQLTILSSTLNSVPQRLQGKVDILSLEPPALLTRLGEKGCRRVYVDGERTIQRFLRADLIMTILPLLIGEGIPLLGTLSDDSKWKHVSTKAFRSGVTQSTYPRDRS